MSESERVVDIVRLSDIKVGEVKTKIKRDSYELVDGVWTFELDDGFPGDGDITNRWYPIPEDPEYFLGLLVHLSQKNWSSKYDLAELICWAAGKFKWKLHDWATKEIK